MPKNIVILLDGTSNEIKKNRSNILRLYGTLKKSDTQVVYYDPGVGTIGAAGTWSNLWRKTVEIWGMATGYGLDQNVKEAYRFLIDTYDDGKRPDGEEDEGRDRIFIFGFSRGAYSARVLAGFIHALGLMDKRNMNLLDYAFRAYKRIGQNPDEGAFDEIDLYKRILRPDYPTVRCLGLFDTVSSVIESGRYGWRTGNHAFTADNRSVEVVRHAVSIEERRTYFRPQLWTTPAKFWKNRFDESSAEDQDVREVWFSGVHGDIGGGYPEEDAALAKIPLHWMIEETQTQGLIYKTRTINELVLGQRKDRDYTAPNPLAKPQNSLTAAWSAVEYVPRKKPAHSKRRDLLGLILPRREPRHIPDGAMVHTSVFERSDLPANLPDNFTKV